ncbi:glycosyltransferase family 4 protein [Crocosphaera chwakensis]|uniref:Glycosyltransferase n=1 Tax=Crocosphaera chwakensis CCY0110 TaxID=391612 RepID=A3IU53_9CHRO|nr:glycosyltransferase family 4 protein [Crocosphaera chwakensis]EAZ90027.1 glycosyltransferase [Crocosphaera chwakensis CCY0110]
MRVGYVVKRYPRYSETFVVNEILAHEKAGLNIDIFALRPPCDSHFQNCISQVCASVTYIRKPMQGRVSESLNSLSPTAASYFWAELQELGKLVPNFWSKLSMAQGEAASTVYQAAWLAREVKLRGITHLHAHFGSVATSVTRLASHFADVPYTFTTHAKDIFHESVDIDDMTRKLRDASTVVTVSDYNQQYLQQIYGKVADKVQKIYNGLNLSQLNYQSPKNRPPRIISVGRLVEKKGTSVLIDACFLLKQWGCEFYCQIVGTGNLETELKQQIEILKLDNCVEIIGPRPQNEVFKLIQESAVFAAPYIIGKDGNRDGLPTVLLEAMALGTPCIGTDVTGIPEMIKHEETGLIIPQNNSEALAIALRTLLTSENMRVQLAEKARNLMETEFNIEENAATLRKLFQSTSNKKD